MSEVVYFFINNVEVIHNKHFPMLLKSTQISKDIITIIKETYRMQLSLCSEESSNLFLSLYVKIRCQWAAHLHNKSKTKQTVSKSQKIKNILHE